VPKKIFWPPKLIPLQIPSPKRKSLPPKALGKIKGLPGPKKYSPGFGPSS